MSKKQNKIFELLDELTICQFWHDGYCDHYSFWMDIVDIYPDIDKKTAFKYIEEWEKAGKFHIAKEKAMKKIEQENKYFNSIKGGNE